MVEIYLPQRHRPVRHYCLYEKSPYLSLFSKWCLPEIYES